MLGISAKFTEHLRQVIEGSEDGLGSLCVGSTSEVADMLAVVLVSKGTLATSSFCDVATCSGFEMCLSLR